MNKFLPVLVCFISTLGTSALAQVADDYHGGISLRSGGDLLSPIAVAARFDVSPPLGDLGLLFPSAQSYQIKIGYEYSRLFGLEAEYSTQNRLSGAVTSFAPRALVGGLNIKGFEVDAIGTLPFWYRFSVLGKAGIRRLSPDADGGPLFPRGPLLQGKVGLGLQYNFSDSIGLRAEVERYRNLGTDRSIADTDGDAVSLGVKFRF